MYRARQVIWLTRKKVQGLYKRIKRAITKKINITGGVVRLVIVGLRT
jgi:hypothetical protein